VKAYPFLEAAPHESGFVLRLNLYPQPTPPPRYDCDAVDMTPENEDTTLGRVYDSDGFEGWRMERLYAIYVVVERRGRKTCRRRFSYFRHPRLLVSALRYSRLPGVLCYLLLAFSHGHR